MGRKQVVLKLEKVGKLIRHIAHALIMVNATRWNVLKKKGVLTSRDQTGQVRKTTAGHVRNTINYCEICKENHQNTIHYKT